jgi:hypothetical protein
MEVMISCRPLPLQLWEENSKYPPRRNLVEPQAGLAAKGKIKISSFFLVDDNRSLVRLSFSL